MGNTPNNSERANAKVAVVGDEYLYRCGTNIAQRRELLDLSQQELAERVGVSYPTVWRWEKGQMEPRRHHKRRLAEALGVSERMLFS